MSQFFQWSPETSMEFHSNFIKERQLAISSPEIAGDEIVESEKEIESEINVREEGKKPNPILSRNGSKISRKQFPKKTRILKLKQKILQNFTGKKARKQPLKSATIFSSSPFLDPFKKEIVFSFENTKISPIIFNNVRMFINKIKSFGYLNSLSILKPYDLTVLQDNAYYESDQIKNFSIYKKIMGCFLNFSKKCKNLCSKQGNSLFLMHPYNKYKMIWDFLNSVFIIFLFFYLPFNVCFSVDLFPKSYYYIYSFILIIDMIFEMNTIYFKYGLEMRDKKKIFLNYMAHDFIFDIIPLFSIFVQTMGNQILSLLILLFFLKVVSLLKISKRFTNRFQFNNKMKGIKELIVFFLLIILVAHLVSCFWFFVGVKFHSLNTDSWITTYELLDKPWQTQYLSSFYWSIVTIMTVGYGDVTPQNEYEKFFASYVILFGCMVLPYSVNSIGLIIQNMRKDEIKLEYII